MKLQGRSAQTFVNSEGKTICISSNKICYFSQAEAAKQEEQFLSIHRRSSPSNTRREKRFYFCDNCRLYHFTSQEPRRKKKVRNYSNLNIEKFDYLGEMIKGLLEEEFSYMGATSDYNNNAAKAIQKAVASAVSDHNQKAVASEVSDHELFDTIKWKIGTVIEEAYMDAVSASRISEIVALEVAKR